jgi:hypothetical protein
MWLRVDELGVEAAVPVPRRPVDQCGHAALLGEHVGTGGVERGAHPVGADMKSGDQVGRLGAGDHGPPQQQGERPPLGVPGTVRPLVDLPGRGEVQCRAELGCGQGRPAQKCRQHGVGLVRHRR